MFYQYGPCLSHVILVTHEDTNENIINDLEVLILSYWSFGLKMTPLHLYLEFCTHLELIYLFRLSRPSNSSSFFYSIMSLLLTLSFTLVVVLTSRNLPSYFNLTFLVLRQDDDFPNSCISSTKEFIMSDRTEHKRDT